MRAVNGDGWAGGEGFTLVEVLVALTLTGIVASALISLLIGQSRFYDRTDDQLNAEQVSQATFDLVSTEIRGAGPTDLLTAEADSLVLRYDLVQAVVCDVTGADEAAMYVFDRTSGPGLTGSFAGIAVSGPYAQGFEYADGWNPTPTDTGAGPESVCVAAGVPGGGSASDYLEVSGWSGNLSGGVPERGALVRGYGSLTFRVAPSGFFATRWSLWRETQELVGPFEAGAAFAYLMQDGSEQSSVGASDFDEVVAVRFTATATGDGPDRYDVRRPLDFEVPFRN